MQIPNVRFIIAAITTFSAFVVYVSRVNLSIAIIAMVDDHHVAERKLTVEQHLANMANRESTLKEMDDYEAFLRAYGRGVGLDNRAVLPIDQTQTSATNASTGSKEQHNLLPAIYFQPSKNSVKTPLISQEKFHWDQTEQGHILGAFFYGYILFQIPGARMAESVGAKWIIMAASAGSAVISLVFPLSTQLNSIHLLMVLRFIMGLCQSAFFPAAYVLFCRWLPERERSVLLPIMFIGSNMGSISTYILSSYLISANYGWPSVFYLSGLVCLLCSLLWCFFGSNGPEDNWLITAKERIFIERNLINQSSESNSLNEQPVSGSIEDDVSASTTIDINGNSKSDTPASACCRKFQQTNCSEANNKPSQSKSVALRVAPQPSWPKLLKSVPIWTLILSMYGNEWSNVVICYELPTYLNKALNYPIDQNGVINSFFQLSYALASPIMSSLGAYMLDKHLFGMRKIHIRKLFQSLATFGQLACFVSVPICGANRGLIILFMFSAIIFKACANAGDIMVSGDLSPEYAGTIFAFANSIGNTAGFFMPLLAGVFVQDAYVREQWTPFWLTTAAIMGCSGLIFLIFGETRRQNFDLDEESQANDHLLVQLELPLEPNGKKSLFSGIAQPLRKTGTTLI